MTAHTPSSPSPHPLVCSALFNYFSLLVSYLVKERLREEGGEEGEEGREERERVEESGGILLVQASRSGVIT